MTTNVQKITKYPEILRLFLKYPGRKFTPFEISKMSKVPYATARRYVLNLKLAGVLDIERIGAYNVCWLNEQAPLVSEIKKIIELELSPHKLAAMEFVRRIKPITQIKRAILFGSVSKGTEKLRSDVDIAVIVEKESPLVEKKLIDIMGAISESSRMNVIPITVTEAEMKEKTQFIGELEKGEIIYERHKRV